MNFLRYFYFDWFNFILGLNFSLCFKLKSHVNIKIPNNKKRPEFRNICFFGLFNFYSFSSLQTWQQKISQRQPQSQTNRYQVLYSVGNYTIQAFFQIKWLNTDFSTIIFHYSCLSHLEHSFFIVRCLFQESSLFLSGIYNSLFSVEILLKHAVWSWLIHCLVHYLAKRSKTFLNASRPTLYTLP